MGETTGISWTQATWNPWHGCQKVSQGCKFCYMYREKERYGQDPRVVQRGKTTFNQPLKWKEPRLIFTCSWSDFFIAEADAWRDEAWDIIRGTPHHTYQILTKRPERIADHVPHDWPLPNVWLGTSIESQPYVEKRIEHLLRIPAVVRFLSCEPLLGPLDLSHYLYRLRCTECGKTSAQEDSQTFEFCTDETIVEGSPISWVITGGESGPAARPSHPDWFRDIRDLCVAAGVAYHHKQNGEWLYREACNQLHGDACWNKSFGTLQRRGEWFPGATPWNGREGQHSRDDFEYCMIRCGVSAAGRLLDGREWNEMPVGAVCM